MIDSRCMSCSADLDHCHGTLVLHGDHNTECTDFTCVDADFARHTLVVDCVEIVGGCRCAEEHHDQVHSARSG